MSERSHVTSHVLDSTLGHPAAGVHVTLEQHEAGEWHPIGDATTDADGRVTALGPVSLRPGLYRVGFDTGAYWAAQQVDTFYPEVQITFDLADADAHYHVPLLLSPFAYSTYRGS
ncbi:hydroxyisourate hydrolase [Herbiconiux sp. P18]|uniref:hydroxyisourate hydrolase n=1 Tax=Herbiconiux liangxiaofengii TaxID=3342795 RepID=UPI0035B911FE